MSEILGLIDHYPEQHTAVRCDFTAKTVTASSMDGAEPIGRPRRLGAVSYVGDGCPLRGPSLHPCLRAYANMPSLREITGGSRRRGMVPAT